MMSDGPGAPAPGPVMLMATRRVLTPCGWVDEGRIVADGDPMLVGCEDAFVRISLERTEEAGGGSARKRSGRRA